MVVLLGMDELQGTKHEARLLVYLLAEVDLLPLGCTDWQVLH